MKTIRFSLIMLSTLALITLFTVSCGNKADSAFGAANVLKRVPSDAAVVAVMNVGQMMNKLNYADFKKTDMFKDLLKQANQEDLKKILENPEASGIAMNGQFCMFADNIKSPKEFRFGFILPVKNVKDLEALFEKAAKGSGDSPFKKIESAKGYKFVKGKKENNEFSLGWNKDILVIIVNTNSEAKESLENIFDLKKDKSILSNKSFKAEKAEKHDVMLWVQSDPIIKTLKEDKSIARSLKMISLLGLTEESLNGNTMALYYDFNKGDMQAGLSYNMNKDIAKEYGIIFKKKMDTDFSAYFPKKNLSVMTMMGLDIKGIREVLKNRGFDGTAESFLKESNITLDDIQKGFTGEIALASYIDPTAKDAAKEQKVVVAIAFNNSTFLDKLLEAPKSMGGGEIKKQGSRYMSSTNKEVQGIVKNNVFVISNDLSILDQIEKGGFKGNEAIEKSAYADMNKGWMSVHVDYTQLFASLSVMPLGRNSLLNTNELMKILSKYDELESANAVVSTEEAKVIVNLKNKDQNSLKVLSQIMNKLYLDRDKIQEQMGEDDMEVEKEVEVDQSL